MTHLLSTSFFHSHLTVNRQCAVDKNRFLCGKVKTTRPLNRDRITFTKKQFKNKCTNIRLTYDFWFFRLDVYHGDDHDENCLQIDDHCWAVIDTGIGVVHGWGIEMYGFSGRASRTENRKIQTRKRLRVKRKRKSKNRRWQTIIIWLYYYYNMTYILT